MRNICVIAAAGLAMAACMPGGGEAEREDVAARDADGETPGMTITSEDGSVTIHTGNSTGTRAGDLPSYPGGQPHGSAQMEASAADGGSGQVVTFQTDDPPAEVIAFYREALESRGYTIETEVTSTQMHAVSASRNDGESGANITATATGPNSTMVSLVVGNVE
ncbi:hypothetical protein [Parasphingopyxis marina]|uniref:Lipoprotein n=1 Tax=Parasphingopyxis marina TaxID=2761622 RepID=A0A842HTM8_9SPHN|nr:hypothetical protein [Parasphingopyxis marina]MBC2776436.1 hypothetical protein [Parasphingopyxis marina]